MRTASKAWGLGVVSGLIALALALGTWVWCGYDQLGPRAEALAGRNRHLFLWIGPTSGRSHLLGEDSLRAITLALEEYESSRSLEAPAIELQSEDDRGLRDVAERLYRHAIRRAEKPLVVFVHGYQATKLVGAEADREGVVLVNPLDNDGSLAQSGKNTFVIAKQTERMSSLIVRGFLRDGGNRAHIVYDAAHSFMTTLMRAIESRLESLHVPFTSCGYYERDTMPEHCVSPRRLAGADGLILLGHKELKPSLAALRARRLRPRLYLADPLDGLALPSPWLDGARFPLLTALEGNEPEASGYLARFTDRFGAPPMQPWVALQAYDAARIVLQALSQVQPERGARIAELLRGALLRTKHFRGASGDISIKPDGSARGIYPSLYELRRGKARKVFDD